MPDPPAGAAGFLSRWSRRKTLVRRGVVPPQPVAAPSVEPVVSPAPPAASAGTAAAPPEPARVAAQPPPTLQDVDALAAGADVRRFVAPGVDATVRNAALKKLFADPRFNVMDGLDTYIDDYGKPDPLPAAMLRRMAQSVALGLFADDPPQVDGAAPTAILPPSPAPHDEIADLRLQPHDAAGPSGPDPGARPDFGREH